MILSRLARLARLGSGAVYYTIGAPDAAQAEARFSARVRDRTARFLSTLENTVWRHPTSPWRRLFVAAGLERGDVVRLVREEGLEGALAALARSGIRASTAELRGIVPLRRGSFELAVRAEEFHNPLLTDQALTSTTSGSSGPRIAVPYVWDLFAEEADAERLLFEAHAAARDPVLLWYPVLPGIAGAHNAILHWRFEQPVSRWFSQTPAASWRTTPRLRVLHEAVGAFGALRGSPRPRHLPLDRAAVIAEWLAEGVRRGERRSIKTFASSAARVAAAALATGRDVAGQRVFTGGEPLTAERLSLLRQAGLTALPRYAATETGMIAGACGEPGRGGEMHLYVDRLAVLVDGRPPADRAIEGALAFTSLAPSAPLTLLNAELGDYASLRRGECSCRLGAAGGSQRIADVTAPEKFAAEGVKLLAMQMAEVAAALVSAAGGTADDSQVWWRDEGAGCARLTVAIDPRVSVDLGRFERDLLARLSALDGGSLAAELWTQAGTIRVVRAKARPGSGAKLPPTLEEHEPPL